MTDPIEDIRAYSDEHASGPDYIGNGYPSAPRHVRVLLREVDRLRSELAAAREAMPTGWRSMDSAPRDGTLFLLQATYPDGIVIEPASWINGRFRWTDGLVMAASSLDAWMPLPPPFTGDTGKRGES